MKTLSYAPQIVTAEELNRFVEFNIQFIVNEDGTVEMSANFEPDEVIGNYPEHGNVFISDGWTARSYGYTGQYGYAGPVMHESEQLSGRIADDILSEPCEYCICEVSYFPEDDHDQEEYEMEHEGWIVVKAI